MRCINSPDGVTIPEPPSYNPPDCVDTAEVLLVRLTAGDSLEVKEYVTGEGGAVHGLSLCMAASQYKELPVGLESLLVTHR